MYVCVCWCIPLYWLSALLLYPPGIHHKDTRPRNLTTLLQTLVSYKKCVCICACVCVFCRVFFLISFPIRFTFLCSSPESGEQLLFSILPPTSSLHLLHHSPSKFRFISIFSFDLLKLLFFFFLFFFDEIHNLKLRVQFVVVLGSFPFWMWQLLHLIVVAITAPLAIATVSGGAVLPVIVVVVVRLLLRRIRGTATRRMMMMSLLLLLLTIVRHRGIIRIIGVIGRRLSRRASSTIYIHITIHIIIH